METKPTETKPTEQTPIPTEQKKDEPKAPLHKGFTGHINTPEELVSYTQKLEEQVASLQASKTTVQPAPEIATPTPTTTEAKSEESFEELIYSDPKKAKELLKKEFNQERDQRDAQKDQKKAFWDSFYVKNPDLKALDRIVQSVVAEKGGEISKLKSAAEVTDFLEKETRTIISMVRGKTETTETKLDSKSAVTLEGNESPFSTGNPNSSPQNNQPISFADQVAKLRRRGRK